VASDAPINATIPRLDLNDPDAIADFVVRQRGLRIADVPRPDIVEVP
jgi:hypothetical protein